MRQLSMAPVASLFALSATFHHEDGEMDRLDPVLQIYGHLNANELTTSWQNQNDA